MEHAFEICFLWQVFRDEYIYIRDNTSDVEACLPKDLN